MIMDENMDVSILIFGSAVLFSLLFWAVRVRKVYVSAILQIEGRVPVPFSRSTH